VIRIVSKTGIYQDEMKEWKKKAVADKTWKNLKAFMVDVQKTNRENKLNNKQNVSNSKQQQQRRQQDAHRNFESLRKL
jgi:hypothetical protein